MELRKEAHSLGHDENFSAQTCAGAKRGEGHDGKEGGTGWRKQLRAL